MMKRASVFLVFAFLGIGCASSTKHHADREPSAASLSPWHEFDYEQPEASGIFQEAALREANLTRREQLINTCGIRAEWSALRPLDRDVLWIRLGAWEFTRLREKYAWLTDVSFTCLKSDSPSI